MSDNTSPRSIGDFNVNAFLVAVREGMDPVRAMCKHPTTGELYEIIGVDRGNGEVVPLFLVPIGGAQTIVEHYKIVSDDPATVNSFADIPSVGVHTKH